MHFRAGAQHLILQEFTLLWQCIAVFRVQLIPFIACRERTAHVVIAGLQFNFSITNHYGISTIRLAYPSCELSALTYARKLAILASTTSGATGQFSPHYHMAVVFHASIKL